MTVLARWQVIVLALVLAACAPRDVTITGDLVAPKRTLLTAALRPLHIWRVKEGRNADLADAAAAMESALVARGYPVAAVAFSQKDDRKGRPHATFTVTPGPPARIGSIRFPGSTVPAEDLRPYLVNPGAASGQHPFIASEIEQGADQVARYYRLNGYLRVQVAKPTFDWHRDSGLVDVTIAIAEGRRYRLDDVLVDSAGTLSASQVEDLLSESDLRGTPYHQRLPHEARARVRSWLQDLGYHAATVDSTADIDEARARVTLRLVVTPGPLHSLHHVTITGNIRTSNRFILHLLAPGEPGTLLSRGTVEAGLGNIGGTGLFSKVRGTYHPGAVPATDATLPTDLVIEVDETPDRRLDLSIGWGSYEQARGGIRWGDDNLFGHGLRYDIGTYASMLSWGGDTGLEERYHLGPGRRLRVTARHDEREEPSFSHRETTFGATLSRDLHWSFDPAARWEWRARHDLSFNEDFAISGGIINQEDGAYRTSVFGLTLRRDSRGPHAVDPSRGMLAIVGVAWSSESIGSQIPWVEHRASLTQHVRLASWCVGVLNGAFITRDPEDRTSLPIGERLFLGGEDSVRSFFQHELGPRDVDGNPIGGLTSLLGNLEMRMRPIPFWPHWEFSAFYDAGVIGQEAWDVDLPAGTALGLGWRYMLPVGPVRVDYGYNTGERFGSDHPWALHATVGFAF